jgi:hypothetical protein
MPRPRRGPPILDPVFQTAVLVLENGGKLSSLVVTRHCLSLKEDVDSIAALTITNYFECQQPILTVDREWGGGCRLGMPSDNSSGTGGE